jgi:hypothetical protein
MVKLESLIGDGESYVKYTAQVKLALKPDTPTMQLD